MKPVLAHRPYPKGAIQGLHRQELSQAGNSYSQYGGIVAGRDNFSTSAYSTVTGGRSNVARGYYSSINGGESNTAVSDSSSSGGYRVSASGVYDWAAGGLFEDY